MQQHSDTARRVRSSSTPITDGVIAPGRSRTPEATTPRVTGESAYGDRTWQEITEMAAGYVTDHHAQACGEQVQSC